MTNFLRENLIAPEPFPPEFPAPSETLPPVDVDLGGLEMNPLEGTEFTLISTVSLSFRTHLGASDGNDVLQP